MKHNVPVFALIVITAFLSGCDMRHAVRVELKQGTAVTPDAFTVRDVMATLTPVIEKHDLKCLEKHEQQEAVVKCKTWPLSATSLQISNMAGTAQVIVDDESPIFFWTPQPYGRIRHDVITALKTKYGQDRLECGQGFSLTIHCNEWPKESNKGK